MNISCVICSDSFVSADSIFTTPCGHIFHHACLIQWLERKKDCPQCRHKCTERHIFRIYFNNFVNLDTSSANSANLIETVDNLTLKVRESEMALKRLESEKAKLEDTLSTKEKKIKKLDTTVSQCNQVIATMRHEVDLLSSHRQSYKSIETENAELKAKLDLLQTVETVLSASQREIDEILKQNLNSKDLAVMVGALRRELNCSEERKNVMRKQIQALKNDLQGEKEERERLKEMLSGMESKNHSLLNRLQKLQLKRGGGSGDAAAAESEGKSVNPDIIVLDTPEPVKRPRFALSDIDDQNTPSPLTRDEFQKRIQKIQESDSPYFRVKASSIGLACAIQKASLGTKTKTTSDAAAATKLSIFRKPHLNAAAGASSSLATKSDSSSVYNGLGTSAKVLQSDLKELDSAQTAGITKRVYFPRKVSASALRK